MRLIVRNRGSFDNLDRPIFALFLEDAECSHSTFPCQPFSYSPCEEMVTAAGKREMGAWKCGTSKMSWLMTSLSALRLRISFSVNMHLWIFRYCSPSSRHWIATQSGRSQKLPSFSKPPHSHLQWDYSLQMVSSGYNRLHVMMMQDMLVQLVLHGSGTSQKTACFE